MKFSNSSAVDIQPNQRSSLLFRHDFAAFLLLLLLLFPTILFAEKLEDALTPSDFRPLESPVEHPALLAAGRHPTTQEVSWNLTYGRADHFVTDSRAKRRAKLEEEYRAVGIAPSSIEIRANEPLYFSALVTYEQQADKWIVGTLVAFDASRRRIFYSSLVSKQPFEETVIGELKKAESRLRSYDWSKTAGSEESPAGELFQSPLLFLLPIGFLVIGAILLWRKNR